MNIKLTEQQQQELLAYIEGTLSADAAARVEVFLANTDPQLAAQIADMMDQRQAVSSLPKLKAPMDMAQRIMEQVERESLLDDRHHDLDMRPWWQSRWVMAASMLMVVSVFGYYVIHAAMKNSDTMDKWQVVKNDAAEIDKQLAVRDVPPAPNAAPEALQGGQQASQIQEQGQALADAANAPADQMQRQAIARNDSNYQVQQNAPLNQAPNARMAQQGAAHGEFKKIYAATLDNAPILVTLAARDSSDTERLRMLLLSMSAASTTMKSAASAPARFNAAENTGESRTAGASRAASEIFQARLTPDSFRRIASQFVVVNIAPAHDARQRAAAKESAAGADQDVIAGAAPLAGEADYIFRFVAADAAKSVIPEATRAVIPAAAPAASARPASTQPTTQNHP